MGKQKRTLAKARRKSPVSPLPKNFIANQDQTGDSQSTPRNYTLNQQNIFIDSKDLSEIQSIAALPDDMRKWGMDRVEKEQNFRHKYVEEESIRGHELKIKESEYNRIQLKASIWSDWAGKITMMVIFIAYLIFVGYLIMNSSYVEVLIAAALGGGFFYGLAALAKQITKGIGKSDS